MFLTSMIAYLAEQIKRLEQPATYGSELERYIVSKNPQTTYEVEHWTTQFDKQHNQKGWPL